MRIDVYYDLICPWCYIGFYRLRRAVSLRPNLPVQVVWHPFQLNPSLPVHGTDQAAYNRVRYGSATRARRIIDGITDIARRDGVPIDLDGIRVTPNSARAHRLALFHAAETGDIEPAIEALMRAHCAEGRNLGSDAVLMEIGTTLGHAPAALHRALEGDDERALVRARDASARRLGIQAVPSLVIDQRFSISGAQEPAALLPLFDAAALANAEVPGELASYSEAEAGRATGL